MVVVAVAAEEVAAVALTVRKTAGPGRFHAEAVNKSHHRFA